ncbi:MTH1187 family thiamine-binding protein [Megasphaera hexanoica]|nr:MTH1187 family thiamine-binding protein [Megasphaera hexanoica]
MNVLAAICIAPCGIGDEFAPYVAPVIQIIRESGLKNRTNSMFTEIEGEWDDVMAVVKKATFYLAEQGLRTEVLLKADIRPGYTEMMEHKTAIVEQLLQETE